MHSGKLIFSPLMEFLLRHVSRRMCGDMGGIRGSVGSRVERDRGPLHRHWSSGHCVTGTGPIFQRRGFYFPNHSIDPLCSLS